MGASAQPLPGQTSATGQTSAPARTSTANAASQQTAVRQQTEAQSEPRPQLQPQMQSQSQPQPQAQHQTSSNAGTHPDEVAGSSSVVSATTPADATLPVSAGSAHTAVAVMQPAPPDRGVLLDRLVAVVNDDLVLESEVQEEMRFAAFQPNGANTRSAAIERLIDRKLIEEQERLQPQQLVSDADLKANVAELRKSLPACAHDACATDAQWRAFLADHGFTEKEFNARWRARMEILAFIEQRFRLGLRIPEVQIEAYYRDTMLPAYAKEHVQAPPLSSISARIQEVLLQQQVTKLLDTWLTTLRTQGNVRLINVAEVGS
ncbi:MAG: SurA N-terminal domain-containing protein [Acidobacteriaceae bacterium]